MENQLYIALKNNRLFENLDASAFDLSDIKGTLITVNEGQILYREDNPAEYIYFIVSGEINLLKKQKEGKTLSFIFTDNDYFGHEELLHQSTRKSTVVALRDSYIIGLSKAELEILISQDERILTTLQNSFNEGFTESDFEAQTETAAVHDDASVAEMSEPEKSAEFSNKKITSFEESGESNYNIDIESFESPEDYEEHNEEFEISKIESKDVEDSAADENVDKQIDETLFSTSPEPPVVDELEDAEAFSDDTFLGGISSEDELKKIDELIAAEKAESGESENQEELEELFESDGTPKDKIEGEEFSPQESDEIIFSDEEETTTIDEEVSSDAPEDVPQLSESGEQLSVDEQPVNAEEIIEDAEAPVDSSQYDDAAGTEESVPATDKPAQEEETGATVAPADAEDEKLSRHHLEMLIKAAEIVNSNIKIDDALSNIVNVACNLLNADRGTLYFVDQGRNELWSKVTMGEEIKEIRLKMGEGIAGWVAESGETVNIENVLEDERFNRTFDSSSGYQTKSMLCYPIKNKLGITVGVIQLLNSKSGEFSKMDEELLEALSIHIAMALENATLVEKLLHGERISSLGKMANFLIQDIKKPILVSKRYADHLKEKDLPPDVKQVLEMMTDQLNHVADLVQTTSNYSEGTSGLRTVPSSINDVLNDYINRLDSYVRTRNSQITKEFDADVTVKIDQKEFFQSFHHIIKNACDAMPEGGTIFVKTVVNESSVQVMIKDNGLGIPESLREKIFEPFMTYGKKEGTGLGLSITKKIIEDHGGTIKVESQLGEGTTIIIGLPLANAF